MKASWGAGATSHLAHARGRAHAHQSRPARLDPHEVYFSFYRLVLGDDETHTGHCVYPIYRGLHSEYRTVRPGENDIHQNPLYLPAHTAPVQRYPVLCFASDCPRVAGGPCVWSRIHSFIRTPIRDASDARSGPLGLRGWVRLIQRSTIHPTRRGP